MIRVRNTRTDRTVEARDGKDAALMARIELDRRSGIAISRGELLLQPIPRIGRTAERPPNLRKRKVDQ